MWAMRLDFCSGDRESWWCQEEKCCGLFSFFFCFSVLLKMEGCVSVDES